MTKGKKKWWYIPVLLAFVIYIFVSPRPIPQETILKSRWITSLESDYPVAAGDSSARQDGTLLPFILGDRFGYIGDDGKFSVNQVRNGYVSLSENNWAEYGALPTSIEVMNPRNESVLTIGNPEGYPLFLDNRIFMVGKEQNSLTALNPAGEELWTYDFPAPITCVDASGGFVLAGTLDGAVLLLDASGRLAIAPFEPGGSRLSVILGCAISSSASHLALISGIDEQRFLLLERSGDTYKVVYHEFLSEGFRRPVHIGFVNNDAKVAFEREGGLGIYSLNSRSTINLSLEGEVVSLDNTGDDEFLFVITSQGPEEKRFITVRFPGTVVNEAPFRSGDAFFARRGTRLYIGGDATIASFELEKR